MISNNEATPDYEEYVVGEDSSSDSSGKDPIVDYALRLYKEYSGSSYRKDKIDEAEDNRKQYDGTRDKKSFPWPNCSNYSLMVPAIVVDNLEPRIVGAVAGKDRDIIECIPNTAKGTETARYMEQFAEWALAHNIKWQQYVPAWIHDVLLDSVGYIFPHYEEVKLKRGKRFIGNVPIDAITKERIPNEEIMAMYQQMGLPVGQQYVDEIQYADTKIFKVVNEFAAINEVFGPDLCPDWDDAPTIRKQFVKYDDLVAMSNAKGGVYVNITDKLKMDATSARSADDKPLGSDDRGAQSEEEREDIEILTLYDKYELDEGDRDWCILSIAVASETVIRRQYVRDAFYGLVGKPCRRLIIFPDYGKQFGTGVPAKIKHFSAAINDCLNQMLDSGTVQINPWFFYGSDAGLQDELDISPGGANPVVGNANSIVFPQLGVKANVYIEFINLITSYLERLVALSSYQSGAEDQVMGQGAGTASGMRMILQEAQIKHTYQAKNLKEQLSEIIKLDMLLYAWYMPTDVDIVVPGQGAVRQINIDALQQDYDFSLRISDSAYNQMMARNEAQELFNISAQLPFANQIEMFKDILSSYDKKNPDQYINPAFLMVVQAVAQNPEIPEVIQQFMQQKAQQQHQQELGQAAQDGHTVGRMKDELADQTLIPDLIKKTQKNMVKRDIEDNMKMDAALEHKDMIGPKDIQDAMASKRRGLAKAVVEGTI